ncbi:MAG: 2-amino-4-hydroxy-6-hydroxymethyldihydropteridine diphosphokinase [Micropepsaceae bacterium]
MIYVALGANVRSSAGPPAVTLRQALAAMPRHGIEILAVSPFYRSEAWPNPADPPFVNAVAEVKTRLLPGQLLKALLAVEKAFGRVRKSRNEPRTLDLDLIDYGGLISDAEQLMLPHPRLHERAFVLRPLADIAPAWRHPDTGEGVLALLRNVGEAGLERLAEA